MKKLMFLIASVAMTAALPSTGIAASIVNNDTETRTVVVTDGGNQQELSLGAGESADFCQQGCFVSLQGERQTLLGTEAVEIKDGRMRVR
jgi:hypothetical protein